MAKNIVHHSEHGRKPFSLNHPDFKGKSVGGSPCSFQFFAFHSLIPNVLHAVDHRGNIFETQIPTTGGAGSTMVFRLLVRCGNPVSSLGFLNRMTMVAGMTDGTFRLYQAQSGSLLCKIKGHRSPVHQVIPLPCREIHSSNVYPNLLTVSVTEIILWNMREKSKMRVLAGASAVGIEQACFDNKGEHVVTLFQDDTVAVWDIASFQCVYKISLKKLGSPENIHLVNPMSSMKNREAPTLDLDPSTTPFLQKRNPAMKERMAFSRDGRYLVMTCSKKPILAIWNWMDRTLHQEIKIPSFESSSPSEEYPIKQICFIGNSMNVAILSAAGQLVIIDVDAGLLVYKMKIKMDSFRISLNGMYLAAQVTHLAHSVKFIPIALILEDQNRLDNPSFLKHMDKDRKVDRFIYNNEVLFDLEDRQVVEKAFGKSVNEKFFTPSNTLTAKAKRKPFANRMQGDNAGQDASKPSVSLMDLVKGNDRISSLNRKRLRAYLDHFGEYPEKYRLLIWRFLLKLPENRHAYQTLSDKGPHSAFRQLNLQYPIKSYQTLKVMERVLSALGHWSPILAESDYIPSLVFPFVTMFHNSWDTFTCFEIMVTVVLNWCQHWFEYYPNPPLHVLNLVEDLVAHHEPKLLEHFKKYKVTAQYYAWPLLQTLFASHFSKSEWCIIVDHLFSNQPEFMYYLVVAYLRYHRDNLLRIYDASDYEGFFNRANPTNIHRWIRLAHAIESKTPGAIKPSPGLIKPMSYIPASQSCYPLFNEYPVQIVNFQRKIHDKIQREELEFIRRRKILDDLDDLDQDLRVDESKWVAQEQEMTRTLDSWWNDLINEEQTHEQDKSKLIALETEKRARVIENIRDARQRFLVQQRSQASQRRDLKTKMSLAQADIGFEEKTLDSMTGKADAIEPIWHARYQQLLSAEQ